MKALREWAEITASEKPSAGFAVELDESDAQCLRDKCRVNENGTLLSSKSARFDEEQHVAEFEGLVIPFVGLMRKSRGA